MVKRVIGLPDEEIAIDFGEVLIDGLRGLDRWSRGQGEESGGHTFPDGSWRIARDEIFVLSDNRAATVDDGRSFGPITTKGVLVMIWPRLKQRRDQVTKKPN